ncbi:MAG: RNA polymerase factor sigma-54 [Sedimentisphaeraceae bacterium JB056]
MALEMNLTNRMQMAQQMKLTPAMMQSMEILQLPIMALEQRIETELNNNPVLELETEDPDEQEEDDKEFLNKSIDEKELKVSENDTAESFERLDNLGADYKEYINQDAAVSVRYDDGEADPKLNALHNTADSRISMQAYLKDQLSLVDAPREVISVIEILIDQLSPKGYLSLNLDEIAAIYDGFDQELFDEALEHLQRFDPPGIGARDVRECLLIQIRQNIDTVPPFTYEIVNEHYDMLLNNHLPQLAASVGCGMDEIEQVLHYLARLDTSPGTKFESGFDNAPVRVDIIVEEKDDGEYDVHLANSALPALRINDEYASMVADKNIDKNTKRYLQENVRNAKWLIDAVNQRQNTLLKIAGIVVSRQKEFFKKGRLHIQPLFMQEVADMIGIHIATVSRAVAGKYIQSPQGQMPLRDLFTNRIVSDDGNVQGTEAIKQALENIINNEDKSKPYSDEKVCKLLEEKGYSISRRTVVKYRDQLGIPASRMRKKFI